jgi:serine/threonine protein kinase
LMTELANGIAWLESLGLTHGDLRPENVLLNNQDHLKIADFGCANLLGSESEICTPPYARLLGSEAGSDEGKAGKLSYRTKQFALGSIFYYINYGFEVYDDKDFGIDHGPVVFEHLQRVVFPKLDAEPVIDSIINDCWHGKYQSISAVPETLSTRYGPIDGTIKAISEEEFVAQREYCRKLVEQGVPFDD